MTVKLMCPRCHKTTTRTHCKSPTCSWCFCDCPESNFIKGRVIIFDGKRRFFTAGSEILG